MQPQFDVTSAPAAPTVVSAHRNRLLEDVREGLAQPQKELDPKYFYDERGSQLFEEITALPEYYPTRAERALLKSVAPELMRRLRPASLVELGAGSASKTRVILDAMRDVGTLKQYVPVDVSGDFLRATAAQLRREYPGMCVDTAVADFATELVLPAIARPSVFGFLGSTIGNFREREAVEILGRVAGQMRPGDHFLLGADLRKDVALIEAAYNDSAGVTAEFNLNILRVINNELGADFDLSRFRHRAVYDSAHHRIEMHLDSVFAQVVRVPGIGEVKFAAGESVRTELSHKYNRESVVSLFSQAGLELVEWIEDDGNTFALALAQQKARP
ncbi:MAG: L-histidine N(alpha)-methyltransferase [Gemmatimonadales bacterium]